MHEKRLSLTHRIGMSRAFGLGAALLLSARVASADDAADSAKSQRRECAAAYEKGQELRASEHLLEARQSFNFCANPECPDVLTKDCLRWLDDLESRTPTFAIAILRNGEPASTASVVLDGKALASEDVGKTLNANPGVHEVKAELEGFEPIARKFQLLQGQHLVVLTVNFESPKAPALGQANPAPIAPPPLAVVSSPTPVATYVFLGVAVAGAGAFTGFGLTGRNQQSQLDVCKPNCSKGNVDARDLNYAIADVSLAVGAAALIGAGVSYFVRPNHTSSADVAKRDLLVTHTAGSWGLSLRSAF